MKGNPERKGTKVFDEVRVSWKRASDNLESIDVYRTEQRSS